MLPTPTICPSLTEGSHQAPERSLPTHHKQLDLIPVADGDLHLHADDGYLDHHDVSAPGLLDAEPAHEHHSDSPVTTLCFCLRIALPLSSGINIPSSGSSQQVFPLLIQVLLKVPHILFPLLIQVLLKVPLLIQVLLKIPHIQDWFSNVLEQELDR